MAVLVGETHNLVLDGGTVTRALRVASMCREAQQLSTEADVRPDKVNLAYAMMSCLC